LKQDVREVFLEAQSERESHLNPSGTPTGLPEAARDPEDAKVPLPLAARVLLVLILSVAVAVLANTAVFWRSPDLIKFGAFLAISLISAGARSRVPGMGEPLPLCYF